jgi:hypothetical protein
MQNAPTCCRRIMWAALESLWNLMGDDDAGTSRSCSPQFAVGVLIISLLAAVGLEVAVVVTRQCRWYADDCGYHDAMFSAWQLAVIVFFWIVGAGCTFSTSKNAYRAHLAQLKRVREYVRDCKKVKQAWQDPDVSTSDVKDNVTACNRCIATAVVQRHNLLVQMFSDPAKNLATFASFHAFALVTSENSWWSIIAYSVGLSSRAVVELVFSLAFEDADVAAVALVPLPLLPYETLRANREASVSARESGDEQEFFANNEISFDKLVRASEATNLEGARAVRVFTVDPHVGWPQTEKMMCRRPFRVEIDREHANGVDKTTITVGRSLPNLEAVAFMGRTSSAVDVLMCFMSDAEHNAGRMLRIRVDEIKRELLVEYVHSEHGPVNPVLRPNGQVSFHRYILDLGTDDVELSRAPVVQTAAV